MQLRQALVGCGLIGLALSLGCSKSKTTAHASKADTETEPSAEEVAPARGMDQPQAVPNAGLGTARPSPFVHAPVPKESLVKPPLTAPADAKVGAGGVRLQVLRAGAGELPGPNDVILVDYSMWKSDGSLALSSYLEEHATTFSVATLSPQLRSLLTGLHVGTKARYWVPRAALQGWRPKEWPDDDLVIEFELRDISRVTPGEGEGTPTEGRAYAPPDAAGPPANAASTRGGLRFLKLVNGEGKRSPAPGERLSVILDGYAIDGLVAKRVTQNLATATTLERAPGTLADVLAQMKSGDTVRVWFPAKLGQQVIPDVGNRELVLDLKLTFTE
jgi:FKBP-type peptidyl-prolyl cis-trans isomerase